MRRLLLLLAGLSIAQALPSERYQKSIDSSSSSVNEASTSLQFALRSYSDPGSKTPDGGVCRCPEQGDCKEDGQCSFTFTFIVFTLNQKTDVYETSEFRLGTNGQLPANQKSEWGRTFIANTMGKPSSLDILVHHRGRTYGADGSLKSDRKLMLVDRFHIDLGKVRPTSGGAQTMQSQDYQGEMLGTRLSLSMSLTCSGDLVGPECDLMCNRSSVNSNVAVCRSGRHHGLLSICDSVSGKQVENCQECPWGIVDDSFCSEEGGRVSNSTRTGCVAVGYLTATVVLFILLLLIALAEIIIFACCKFRKMRKAPAASVAAPQSSQDTASTRLLSQHGSQANVHTGIPDASNAANMQPMRGVQSLEGVSVSGFVMEPPWIEADPEGERCETFKYGVKIDNNSGHKIWKILIAPNSRIREPWDLEEVGDDTFVTPNWMVIENGESKESSGYISYGRSNPTILQYKIVGGEVVTAA